MFRCILYAEYVCHDSRWTWTHTNVNLSIKFASYYFSVCSFFFNVVPKRENLFWYLWQWCKQQSRKFSEKYRKNEKTNRNSEQSEGKRWSHWRSALRVHKIFTKLNSAKTQLAAAAEKWHIRRHLIIAGITIQRRKKPFLANIYIDTHRKEQSSCNAECVQKILMRTYFTLTFFFLFLIRVCIHLVEKLRQKLFWFRWRAKKVSSTTIYAAAHTFKQKIQSLG